MSSSTEQSVVAAMEAALRDVGWDAVTNPARLRAILSDLLGAEADDHRGALDALVISADEGIPGDLLAVGRSGAATVRPELVSRLQEWGLTPERTAWVIDAWESLIPEAAAPPPPISIPTPVAPTALPPTSLPPEPAPEPQATPEPEPGPEPPAPEAPIPAAATPLSPVEPTALPPTSLPGDAATPAPLAPTSLPNAAAQPPEATELPAGLPPPAEPDERSEESDSTSGHDDDAAPDETATTRSRWPWVAAVVLALIVGGGAFAAISGSSDDRSDTDNSTAPTTESRAAEGTTMASGTIISAPDANPAEASGEFAMAGKNGGVSIAALGTVNEVVADSETQQAADGGELVAFTLAKGPCENRPCNGWEDLNLWVAVGGESQALPAGGPTYVVAAPADDSPLELIFDANGIEQSLSLRDGEATGDNIEVLLRTDRRTQIGVRETIEPTATNLDGSALDFILAGTTMTANARTAELFFFGSNEPPANVDMAYLSVDLSYTRGTSTNQFEPSRLVTFEADGRTYKLRDLSPGDRFEGAFIVPADLRSGTLIVEGSREVPTSGGESYLETVPRTTFPIKF